MQRGVEGLRRRGLAAYRGWLQQTGGALLETALVVGFLVVPLILGTTDMAALVYASIEISNAAHAGALAAMSGTNTNAAIQTAAQVEAGDYPAANVIATPTAYYACSAAQGGTQYSTQALATAGCTGTGNHSVRFVQVQVSAQVPLPFSCCGLSSPVTLNAKSVMEVE
jgi:Flp pilus assembly protein TadG